MRAEVGRTAVARVRLLTPVRPVVGAAASPLSVPLFALLGQLGLVARVLEPSRRRADRLPDRRHRAALRPSPAPRVPSP